MAIFSKATKKQLKLRLALVGPSGSGKTYTALVFASHLGKRVAVIDSEHGSASKYADLFGFDTLELSSFAPATYIDALHAAEAEGYDVVVIDSLSHAWSGKDGALELVDRAAKRSQSGSTFNAWREITPQHNALVEAMLSSRCNVIATMRTKTEYVMEKGKDGKMAPRKVGLAPIQREGLEYEMDVIGDMTIENDLIIAKTRCPALAGQVYSKPGANVIKPLIEWLGQGAPQALAPATTLGTALPQKPANAEPDYESQILRADSFDTLKAISSEIAKNVIKGDARRSRLAKLLTDRKAELEKVASDQLPRSDVNGFVDGGQDASSN